MRLSLSILLGVALVSPALAQVPNYVPSDGLVGWWPFNGNANDESGNGNDGVVNNAILDADRLNNPNSAYLFNGSNSSIVIGDPIDGGFDMLGGPVSISLWLSTSESMLSSLVTKQNTAIPNSNGDYNLDMNALGEARMAMGFGEGQGAANVSGVLVNDNEWHHIVGTYTPVSIELYVDGILATAGSSSISAPSTLLDSPQPLQFGTAVPNSTPLNGKLDDIGIWNRVLTPEEIAAIYSASSLGMGDSYGSANAMQVFPNPAHGQFSVELELKGLVSLQVYDAKGKLVHNEVFQANGSKTVRTIHLSEQATGSYTLRLQNKGETVTQTVVVE